jgi:hypothetical protein
VNVSIEMEVSDLLGWGANFPSNTFYCGISNIDKLQTVNYVTHDYLGEAFFQP